MQPIRNPKVGARLALGFGLVVGLFLIVTAVGYSGLVSGEDSLHSVGKLTDLQDQGKDLSFEASQMTGAQNGYALNVARFGAAATGAASADLKDYKQASAALTATLAKARSNPAQDAAGRAAVASIASAAQALDATIAQADRLFARGTRAGRQAGLVVVNGRSPADRGRSERLAAELEAKVAASVAATAKRTAAAQADAADSAQQAQTVMLIVAAIALLLAGAIAFVLSSDIKRRLEEIGERLTKLRDHCATDLKNGLTAIARGDHTVPVVPVTPLIENPAKDEIGQIAISVNTVRDRTVESVEAYEQVRGTLGEALGPHSCLVPLTERLESLTNRCMAGLEGALERIAAGDLTVEVTPVTTPVASESGEPVGHLAEVFNSLLDRTQNAVGSYGDMRVKVREMLGEISSTSQTVAAASQQMASTSEEAGKAVGEIATAVGEVATGAERQVRSVEAAREATQEMAGAAQQSAASAEQTATAAKQARAVAEEGAAAVAEATEAMSAVRESSQEATTAIRELGDKSEQIGGIVDTISGIAEQTNLLALNAAIEAARAGEQGRGFAVVAEEVRKLAEESQDAAASIARLIEEITAQTSRAVEVVEKGGQQTHDGSATVERARESFLAIQGAVDDMNGRIEDIAASVQQIASSSAKMETDMGEVAAVAEQSSASSEQVSASTEQTSASTQEIASSAQQLAGTAEELERLVGQFQLEPA